MKTLYKQAAEAIKKADALIVTTGAGMGVDSGLPDFRGNEGFWKAYPPIAKLGVSFSSMANPKWFEEKPELAWAFYGHRLNLYRKTIPHKGYEQLLEIGNSKPYGYFAFTSNVDGQFQKAGFDDERIEEVHGSIHHLQCTVPCSNDIWSADESQVIVDEDVFEAQEPLLKCPSCGAIARPNILMFGDWHWLHERSAEQSNKFDFWLNELKNANAKPVIIEFGAGKAVPTVRHKSQQIAKYFDATLIRINPRDYEIYERINGISISGGAMESMNEIFKLL